MNSLFEIAEKLKKSKNVAVFCHIRPDGDTIGSAYSLKLALEKIGIKTDILCDDCFPDKFNYLLNGKQPLKAIEKSYDCFFAIDCADISRVGSFAKAFSLHKNTICMDHHVSNTGFARINYVQNLSANCMNVYYLIKELGVLIDEKIANFLAAGIMTDTGRFCHKGVESDALRIVAELKDNGADLNAVNRQLFALQSKNRAKLFGNTMKNLKYYYNDKLVVATVLKKDIAEANAKSEETEGFIDFIMGIEGVEVGACILQVEKNKYKISFRSNGDTDVNAVAGMFGGGGHVLASGCQLFGEYEEVADKIVFAVGRHLKDVL